MAKTIKIEDVQKLPRGRKPDLDPALTKTLKTLKTGQALVLEDEFGQVDVDNRSRVSQTIRKHWKDIHGDSDDAPKPSVNFTPEGVAQVFIKKA